MPDSDVTGSNPIEPDGRIDPLDAARVLIEAGAPVFVLPRTGGPGTIDGYHLPKSWQDTPADLSILTDYRPGDGLAMVCGHTLDAIDVDPRNGGTLLHAPDLPTVYAEVATPSGGKHYFVASLRVGNTHLDGELSGVDIQSGRPDGTGRGFVFLPGTKRPSKELGKDAGRVRPYVYVQAPDPVHLASLLVGDDSGGGWRALAGRPRTSLRTASVQPSVPGADPFTAPPRERTFTMTQAQDFVRPFLVDVASAGAGRVEERCNAAAVALSHFVPTFWSVDEAYGLLHGQVSQTFGGQWRDGVSGWTLDKFKPVLSGARPSRDAWSAVRVPDAAAAIAPTEATPDAVDALLAELLDTDAMDALPPPMPLVNGLLDLDSESWIIGASGDFKSFIAIDIAAHVGTGQYWQGRRVEQGPVLYMAAEGGKGVGQRKRAWEAAYGMRMTDVLFLPRPVQVTDRAEWPVLIEAAKRIKAKLIVIDTQARVTAGLNENDAGAMSLLTEAVRALRAATGACVLVVHHIGRNGGDARGSSAIDAAQDAEIRVRRPDNKLERRALHVTVSTDKLKDGDDSMEHLLQMQVMELGKHPVTGDTMTSLAVKPLDPFAQPTRFQPDHLANLPENQKIILEVLSEHATADGATTAEIARWIKERRGGRDIKRSSLNTALKRLEEMERLYKNGARWSPGEPPTPLSAPERADLGID